MKKHSLPKMYLWLVLVPLLLVIIGLVQFFTVSKETDEPVITFLDRDWHVPTQKRDDPSLVVNANSPVNLNVTHSNSQQPEDSQVANEGGMESVQEPASETVSKSVETLIFLSQTQDTQKDQLVGEVQQQLLTYASQNEQALNDIVNAFKLNMGNAEVKDSLFSVLSEFKDPAVEGLAVEFAQSSDRAKRLTGLDLLGELAIPSKENLDMVRSVIKQNETDVDVVLSALHALPVMPLPESENTSIIGMLSELSQQKDEGVRSESILSMGRWAKTPAQLEGVINALTSSPIIDDRVSAAMALENSPVKSDDIKGVLYQRVTDEKELPEIRMMSANALNKFSLSESEFSAVTSFRLSQQQ